MSTDNAVKAFISYCRLEAKKYTELADTVEAKLRAGGTLPLELPNTEGSSPVGDEKVVELARHALSDKNRRLKELMVLTGATKRQARRILTEENGFEIAERGWIKLREN